MISKGRRAGGRIRRTGQAAAMALVAAAGLGLAAPMAYAAPTAVTQAMCREGGGEFQPYNGQGIIINPAFPIGRCVGGQYDGEDVLAA